MRYLRDSEIKDKPNKKKRHLKKLKDKIRKQKEWNRANPFVAAALRKKRVKEYLEKVGGDVQAKDGIQSGTKVTEQIIENTLSSIRKRKKNVE